MRGTMAVLLLVFFSFILGFPQAAFSTPEYAARTGKNCAQCHIDPAGGGGLTADGTAHKNELKIKGLYRELSPFQRIVRFIIGYVHTMTAIIWFGTILYVHLVLKPAYAARGLPKGELMLGWASIVIMAVTGTLLSISRVPDWGMLINTRFGVLLSIKIVLFLIMASTAFFVTFIIGPKLRKKRDQSLAEGRQDLTQDELSQFDGREGRPSYIAYKGSIYDVSGSRMWHGGSHMRIHSAGMDLSDILKKAPHGEDRVFKMPLIGKVMEQEETKKPMPMRVFYFFAYMNLALIFLIVFVISLWRWW